MKTEHNHACSCQHPHAPGALTGCSHRAEEFLAHPTAVYRDSRRGFLTKVLAGGLTVATLPLIAGEAEADPFTPSVADQKRLGEQSAQQILQKYREVRDSRSSHFDEVGARLVNALPANDRNTWDYKFHVIDSKEINAFALPGGNMFMFTGLMDRIRSDDELAAVTGHEMTHVRHQDWAHAYAGQRKREMGLAVLLGLTRAGRSLQQLAGVGEQLYTLKFSRGEEDSADAGGLQDMVDAGYNPQGMLDLFHTLQTASGSAGSPPAFLSDHPLTTERIKRTQQRINALHRSR